MDDSKERIEIVRIIRRIGVFTGSRRFGVHNNDSDYDYVISKKRFDSNLKKYLSNKLIKWFDGSGGDEEFFDNYKIRNNGRSYDIIVPYNQEDYIAWVDATENMVAIDKKFLSNKFDRIDIFEMFRRISISVQRRS